MAEVAKHAGVGIGTVSRVLQRQPEGQRHRPARRCRPPPSSSATTGHENRTLNRAKGGRLIAVLVPFFDEKSAFQRIRGIVSRLAPHGCEVVLHNVESPGQARAKLVELPRSLDPRRPDRDLVAVGRRRRRPSGQRPVPDGADRHVVSRPAQRVHRRSRRRCAGDQAPHLARAQADRLRRRAAAQRLRVHRRRPPRGGVPGDDGRCRSAVPAELVRYGAYLHSAAQTDGDRVAVACPTARRRLWLPPTCRP